MVGTKLNRSQKEVYLAQYKTACGGRRPHPAVVNGIRNYELKLCLDSVNEADIKGIATALPQFALLKRVQLWGKHFTEVALNPDISFQIENLGASMPKLPRPRLKKDVGRRRYDFPNPYDKSKSEIIEDLGQVCISRNPVFSKKLFAGISKNLATNSALCEIRILGLKIKLDCWKLLARGLMNRTPLTYLALNYCKLDDEALVVLTPALRKQDMLRKLDLSHNELSDQAGYCLGRIISRQGERRDEEIWALGLRNEFPESQLGLEELCVANNKLTDKAVEDLCGFLFHDVWLHVLDLRRNCLTGTGLREVANLLSTNKSIIVLDFRENPSKQFANFMVGRLHRNFKQFEETYGVREDKHWLTKLQELKGSVGTPRTESTKASPRMVKVKSLADFWADQRPTQAKSGAPLAINDLACDNCRTLQGNLDEALTQVDALTSENKMLRRHIQQSWSHSGISPEPMSSLPQVESLSLREQGGTGEEVESGLLMRIEQMMSEVTRLMDALEVSQRRPVHALYSGSFSPQ
jgi:hypothetical protein